MLDLRITYILEMGSNDCSSSSSEKSTSRRNNSNLINVANAEEKNESAVSPKVSNNEPVYNEGTSNCHSEAVNVCNSTNNVGYNPIPTVYSRPVAPIPPEQISINIQKNIEHCKRQQLQQMENVIRKYFHILVR